MSFPPPPFFKHNRLHSLKDEFRLDFWFGWVRLGFQTCFCTHQMIRRGREGVGVVGVGGGGAGGGGGIFMRRRVVNRSPMGSFHSPAFGAVY